MGGSGASSGISARGRKYGTECRSVLTVGNIKFVTKTDRSSETLVETMTQGRVYVHVEVEDIKSIVYFDNDNKRVKQIDLDHMHQKTSPHAHEGYNHDVFSKNLTTEERAMVDRVKKAWEDYLSKL